MKKMSETIVFFGSGPVAAEALKLLSASFNIEAVITKPQPEHHPEKFPVIKAAEELGLKIIYAQNKAELIEQIKSSGLASKVGVVVDYGIIIPKEVINYFPLGIINSHF